MANEAILRVETGLPINMTCADGTGIEKGTILKLTDPLTASASDGANDIVAGIAASEKIASDGTTSVAVYRQGIFDIKASGAISVGDPVGTSATANHVQSIANTTNLSGSKRLGFALETATDGEVIQVELNIGSGV